MNVYNFVLYNVYLHKYVNVFNDNENEYSNNNYNKSLYAKQMFLVHFNHDCTRVCFLNRTTI